MAWRMNSVRARFLAGDLFQLGHRFVVELDEDALHIDEYIEELGGRRHVAPPRDGLAGFRDGFRLGWRVGMLGLIGS